MSSKHTIEWNVMLWDNIPRSKGSLGERKLHEKIDQIYVNKIQDAITKSEEEKKIE